MTNKEITDCLGFKVNLTINICRFSVRCRAPGAKCDWNSTIAFFFQLIRHLVYMRRQVEGSPDNHIYIRVHISQGCQIITIVET